MYKLTILFRGAMMAYFWIYKRKSGFFGGAGKQEVIKIHSASQCGTAKNNNFIIMPKVIFHE